MTEGFDTAEHEEGPEDPWSPYLPGKELVPAYLVSRYAAQYRATLRSLTGDWTAPSGATVFVCENPTLAETATDALGPDCPPLVCTDGTASGAALDLLAGLATAGCPMMARADIDTAGFTVVEQVLSVAPNARLWRFDAHLYAAVHGLPLPVDVPEEADLALAQLRNTYDDHRVPLHEERILHAILADLREARRK